MGTNAQTLCIEGKTLTSVDCYRNEDLIYFKTSEGQIFKMYHHQNCCENVGIEDICGDLNDLVGSPLIVAEEITEESHIENREIGTLTFYKFATAKGSVTISWHGASNGYYSEEVSFEEVK